MASKFSKICAGLSGNRSIGSFDLFTQAVSKPKPAAPAGAAGFGFENAWVNRLKDPIDRLPNKPAHILENLETIPSFFGK